MKKLNMLLVVAILVTALIAQALPAKLVRLEVYNWTGENVYIRLEGITTGQFYYLTVPPTTRANWYQPKVYTIMTDYYTRTTWACGGVETSGQYRVVKNNRLNFTACDTLPLRTAQVRLPFWGWVTYKAPNFGEPTMEKVVYFAGVSNKVWMKIPLNVPLGIDKNLWVSTAFDIDGPGFGVGRLSVGAPFELQEYCAPNNCFYRVWFQWDRDPAERLIPEAIFYGPGASNRFRYRY